VPSPAYYTRPRRIAGILFAFGAYCIADVLLPRNEPGFHCETEDAVVLVGCVLYGLTAIGLGVGVWFAQEWARWMGGIGSLLFVAFCTWANLSSDDPLRAGLQSLSRSENVLFVLFMLLLTWVGICCLRPSTGTLFAQAREARARLRSRMTPTDK